MKVTIEKKAFELKFGFRCLMNYGKKIGVNSYGEVIKSLQKMQTIGGNMDFETADNLEALIKTAIETADSYKKLNYTVDDVDVLEWMFTNPDQLELVAAEILNSMPQGQGKTAPAKKSRQKKSA